MGEYVTWLLLLPFHRSSGGEHSYDFLLGVFTFYLLQSHSLQFSHRSLVTPSDLSSFSLLGYRLLVLPFDACAQLPSAERDVKFHRKILAIDTQYALSEVDMHVHFCLQRRKGCLRIDIVRTFGHVLSLFPKAWNWGAYMHSLRSGQYMSANPIRYLRLDYNTPPHTQPQPWRRPQSLSCVIFFVDSSQFAQFVLSIGKRSVSLSGKNILNRFMQLPV